MESVLTWPVRDFVTPPLPIDAGPCGDEKPTRPYDLLLALLPPKYRQSITEMIYRGMIDAEIVGGDLWIERAYLDAWLLEAGFDTHDPTDPSYIADWLKHDHNHRAPDA